MNIAYFGNETLSIKSPFDAVSNGVGYMPRERKIEGIFSSMDVTENMTSSQLKNFNRFGFLKQNEEQNLAREMGRSTVHQNAINICRLWKTFRRKPAKGCVSEMAIIWC